MALDSAVGVEWVIDSLRSDATLMALLAGSGVYRDSVPRGVDIKLKPAIVVNLQSTSLPLRPLKRLAQSQANTKLDVKTKIVMQSSSYVPMRAVANRLLTLLDSVLFQAANGGTIYECVKGQDGAFETVEEGIQFKHMELRWDIRAKAT